MTEVDWEPRTRCRSRSASRPAPIDARPRATSTASASPAATSCSPTTAARSSPRANWKPLPEPPPRYAERALRALRRRAAEQLPARFDAAARRGAADADVARVADDRRRRPAPAPAASIPDARPTSALGADPARALPAIVLRRARPRLATRSATCSAATASRPSSSSRCDDDGRATLRFGDGVHGARRRLGVDVQRHLPDRQRRRGNVGAGAIRHLVTTDADLATRSSPRPQPAAGRRRHRPGAARAGAPRRAAGVPHAGARRHAGGLRGGRRAPPRGAARRGDAPLDRQLAHRLPHRRPPRRRRRSTRAFEADAARRISSASAWPATTSRSTRRATSRSRSSCTSASSPTTSAATSSGALLEALSSGVCPTGARLLPPRQLHVRPAGLPQPVVAAAARGRRASRRSRSPPSSASALPSRTAIDDGVLAIGRLEIARLDNDPNFPERGVLRLDAAGRPMTVGARPIVPSCDDCGCCEGIQAQHAEPDRQPARPAARSPTASARSGSFLAQPARRPLERPIAPRCAG